MNEDRNQLLEQCGISRSTVPVIDTSAWIGNYPFRHIPNAGLDDLRKIASAENIQKLIVSPYEAVFNENSLRPYEQWADQLAGDSLFEVWPVVRPGAMFGLEKLLDRYAPSGIRLLPNYHGYHLYEADAASIMDLARERNLVVQIFCRISDERWHYMLTVPELPAGEIDYATAVYDSQPLLISGMNGIGSLGARMKEHPALYADVSRVRGPVFGMEQIAAKLPADRLVFGSLWPMQIIEATLWQVTSAKMHESLKSALLRDNAAKLLRRENR